MYIIIGANGFLGSYFIKNILEYTNDTILAVARKNFRVDSPRVHCVSCDVTDYESVSSLNEKYFKTSKNNKVLFLAAYHHPDLVEENPRTAWHTNITSLSVFLNTMENVTSLFYPSSDSVYGESVDGYRFKESDDLRPVNRYGIQKSVAERLVTGYGYNVVRFPFLIAPSLLPNREHFYDQIVQCISAGNEIEMFKDSYRSAISFDTAAHVVVRLMEENCRDIPNVLNVCGDEALSKYDIGLKIANKLNISEDLIKPISIDESVGIYTTKRASSTLMDNSLVKKILGIDNIKLEL